MKYFKLIKILFLIAGLMLSVKPMLGFSILGHAKTEEPVVNIWLLQRLFSKRKQDYLEDDLSQVLAIQRRLADIDPSRFLTLCYFMLWQLAAPLTLLYRSTSRYITELSLRLLPEREIYLSVGKLTI